MRFLLLVEIDRHDGRSYVPGFRGHRQLGNVKRITLLSVEESDLARTIGPEALGEVQQLRALFLGRFEIAHRLDCPYRPS